MDRAVLNRRGFIQTVQLLGILIISALAGARSYGQSTLPQQVGTCSGVPINFVPSGAINGTTYTWTAPTYSNASVLSGGAAETNPQNSVVQTLTLDPNATAPASATYTVTTSAGNSFQLTVNVNPLPVLSSSTAQVAICSGTPFNDYTPRSATPGTNISWSRALVSGISNNGTTGQGTINEVLRNITTDPVDVTYSFVLNANGCRNDQAITVTVNPTPFLTTTVTPSPICSGTTFTYHPSSIFPNTSYAWESNSVPGVNNGRIESGTGDINATLSNSTLTSQPVSFTYTLTDNSTTCVGTQVVTVAVNVTPTVASQTLTVCNGAKFFVSPTTVPPIGTLYTWSAPYVAAGGSVTGGSSGVDQYYIGQALVNSGSSSASVVYNVTPRTFGCTGADFAVIVNVSTTGTQPSLTSNLTPPDICSGNYFNYLARSNATGATFAWQRFFAIGISTTPTPGNTGIINEILTNGATFPVPVHYAITTTAGGCSNTDDVTVIVNAAPVLSSSLTPAAICSGTQFNYAPTSLTPYVSFNWTRAVTTGISNPSASGADNPAEVLVNTTSAPITVSYTYSLITVNGCTNPAGPETVRVVVNPVPVLTSLINPPAICSGSKFDYTPTATPTSSITWTRSYMPLINNGSGGGANNPSEILVSNSRSAVSVPYVFRATANGCSSETTVNATVNPTPNVPNLNVSSCSGTAFVTKIDSVPSNTLYSWTAPTVSPVGSVNGASAGTSQSSISQLLTNQTTNAGIVTYTVSPIAGTCSGATFKVVVTSNPTPSVANQTLAPVCSGSQFTFAASSVPLGTTYTWSSPVQSTPNSLVGGGPQAVSQPIFTQALSSSNNIVNTATYTVTPSFNGCVGNPFTLSVAVNPVPAVNNISDTICSGSTFFKSPASVPANTQYTWTTPVSIPFGAVVGGSAQTVAASLLSQTLVNATNDNAQLLYTITPIAGACAGPTFTLDVTVGVPLPFAANQSTQICSGTAFDVTPAGARAGTSYTWSVPTVTPANAVLGISAASTPQASISQTLTNLGLVTDTVVYTVLPYNTGCRGNLFTATVRVIALPKASITGNAVICRYPTDSVTVNFTGQGPWTYSYLNDTQTGQQKGVTTAAYRWGVSSVPLISTRTLQVFNVKDQFCLNDKDTAVFVQHVNPLPVAGIVSLHGAYICNNVNDTLRIVTSDTALTYQWTHNNTPISGATTPGLVTLAPGNYNARITNQYGCVDTASANVNLTYIDQPSIAIAFDTYCINTLAHFTNLTDTSSLGLTKWAWDFGDSTGTTTFNTSHTYLRGGKHHLKLTAMQVYCPAYTTSLDSTIDVQIPIPGITMPSVSTYVGTVTPIAVRKIPGYRYLWDPAKGIDKPDSASVNFNLSATQQYQVHLISTGGCVTIDSLLVRVFDDKLVNIFVPKSFTPNNDGINDVLYPYLAGMKSFKYFKVYNRFGKELFSSTNPDVGWNGSFAGTAQPLGIYIWVASGIALDGSPVERKGEVMLLR